MNSTQVSILVVTLVWVHLVADFVLQTDSMAINKSKSNGWLLYHVLVYSTCFLGVGVKFALLNGLAHFGTDWLSSRATSHYWAKGDRHTFFVIIGVDQAVHLSCLVLSANYLGMFS